LRTYNHTLWVFFGFFKESILPTKGGRFSHLYYVNKIALYGFHLNSLSKKVTTFLFYEERVQIPPHRKTFLFGRNPLFHKDNTYTKNSFLAI